MPGADLPNMDWELFFMSYWQPNLAALTSTSAGILQLSFKKFLIYSLFATISWSIFWGVLVYFLGEAALSLVGLRFVIFAIAAWIAFRILFKKSPEGQRKNASIKN